MCWSGFKIENIYQQKNIWDITIFCNVSIINSGISELRVKQAKYEKNTFGKKASKQICFSSIRHHKEKG